MHIYRTLIAAALLAISISAQAAVTITIKEVGDDVVITGSGGINSLRGKVGQNNSAPLTYSWLGPTQAIVMVGHPSKQVITHILELNGPVSFGVGDGEPQTGTNTGDPFGLIAGQYPNNIGLFLPSDYVLGSALHFSQRFPGKKMAGTGMASMGIEAGIYKWTWGTPTDGDSVTLYAGVEPPLPAAAPTATTAVPGLGSFCLIGLAGAIGAAGVAMTRRRQPR